MEILTTLAAIVLKSTWTWVLSGITAAIYGGYKLYHHWQDEKIRSENKELKWDKKKSQLEQEAQDEADKDIDDPYDYLGS